MSKNRGFAKSEGQPMTHGLQQSWQSYTPPAWQSSVGF